MNAVGIEIQIFCLFVKIPGEFLFDKKTKYNIKSKTKSYKYEYMYTY